jgi:hypothetical protein
MPTMKRAIFQAEPVLLERARRLATERGVSFAELVRDSLEKEVDGGAPRRMPRHSLFDSRGRFPSAREATESSRGFPPRSWRSS